MPQRGIDRDKLWAAIRKLGDEYVFNMLDDAIDLLPQSKLVKLVGQYLDLAQLRPDGKAKGTLLAEAQALERASLKGEYYESRNVRSKMRLNVCSAWRHRRGRAHGSPSAAAMDSLWTSRPTYSMLKCFMAHLPVSY